MFELFFLIICAVDALNQIAKRMGAVDWNFNAEACEETVQPKQRTDPERNIACSCQFENNTCHVIGLYVFRLKFLIASLSINFIKVWICAKSIDGQACPWISIAYQYKPLPFKVQTILQLVKFNLKCDFLIICHVGSDIINLLFALN